ncbi:MAG: hypothetical protein SVO01_00395 [Thermotogota bacterium]|nr:hypothetical protein [Thermotogota bacterium]
MERITYATSWNPQIYSYVWGEIIESETFFPSPYTKISLSLLRIGKGYGYKDGWGILDQYDQEDHPSYANSSDGKLIWFASEEEAREEYDDNLNFFSKKFPR